MKKLHFSLMAIVFALFAMVSFTACSSDDDDTPSTENVQTNIIGMWQPTHVKGYDWDENDEPRPRIVASPKHSDYTSDYEVCRITENLGYDCGIFIKDFESGEVVETGYAFLEFGSIDSLLDELPEITE